MHKSVRVILTSVVLLLINTACATSGPVANADAERAEQEAVVAMAVPAQSSNLSRDATTQIVTDSGAKLQWEDNAQEPITKTWEGANEHCNDLNFSGHTDWRLATTEELVVLAKATKVKFGDESVLKNLPSFDTDFWSSDTLGSGAARAVKFDTFDYGEIQDAMYGLEYSVRCVRDLG